MQMVSLAVVISVSAIVTSFVSGIYCIRCFKSTDEVPEGCECSEKMHCINKSLDYLNQVARGRNNLSLNFSDLRPSEAVSTRGELQCKIRLTDNHTEYCRLHELDEVCSDVGPTYEEREHGDIVIGGIELVSFQRPVPVETRCVNCDDSSSDIRPQELQKQLTHMYEEYLLEMLPNSCTDLKADREGHNYVKTVNGMYLMKCESVPSCGPGLWNSVHAVDASDDNSWCPAGMFRKLLNDRRYTCSMYSKTDPVCVSYNIKVNIANGAERVCIVANTTARNLRPTLRSYLTVAAKNGNSFSGITAIYNQEDQPNPVCECTEALDGTHRDDLLKDTRHVRYFRKRNGVMTLACSKYNRVVDPPDFVREALPSVDVSTNYFNHELLFDRVDMLLIKICSVHREENKKSVLFGLDYMNVYVQ